MCCTTKSDSFYSFIIRFRILIWAKLLESEFHIPVFVENESNLSVLGESAFHHYDQNMVLLNIHDGIGMGIMINGHLYRGQDGYAGEIGHTILFPDGKPCPCGNHGCLEQYASEKAILEEYARLTHQEQVTIDTFVRDYQNQVPEALEMMELFSKYISIAINNIINTFNIELVVLNSSFLIIFRRLTSRFRTICTIIRIVNARLSLPGFRIFPV